MALLGLVGMGIYLGDGEYIRPLAKVLSRSLYSNIFEDYQLLINN